MSLGIKGLVESPNTIALLTTDENEIECVLSTIPSAVSSRRYNILQKIQNLAQLIGKGATVSTFADCPEWPFNENSEMLRVFKKVYRDLFEKNPTLRSRTPALKWAFFTERFRAWT